MVADFCSQYPDARRQPLLWRWHGGNADHRVSHLLPQAAAGRNHDGFFYACLRKRD
jgi:16S rRNA C967 or C1407 C5-methylase (RsmB/RsmF family)